MTKRKNSIKRQVTLDGLLTVGLLDNGLRVADFMCCEDVQMEPFIAKCKVQGMRDGNMYISEHCRKESAAKPSSAMTTAR